MRGHSVHRRAHAEFAHSKINVARHRIHVKALSRLEDRTRRGSQVRRPAKQLRYHAGNGIHHLSAGVARGQLLVLRKTRNRLLPPGLQLALLSPYKLRRQLRIGRAIAFEMVLPLSLQLRAAIDRLAPILQRRGRNHKALVLGKSKKLLRRRRSLRAHRFAVHFIRTRLGAAVADHRPHGDNRRSCGLRLGRLDGLLNGH